MQATRAGTRPSAVTSLALLVAMMVMTACTTGDAERARRAAEVADLHGQFAEVKKNQDAAARERVRLAEQVKAIDAQQAFVLVETKAVRQELDQLQKEVGQVASALHELRLAVEEVERKAAAPPAASSAVTAKPGAESAREASPEKLYASAMASFRSEEHRQAVLEFGELVDRFPQHPLASNSQYWIGEVSYRQRDFPQALVEFQKVVDGYPQSAQVPEALLKLGLCHRALKDTAAARESFERVVKQYPGTTAASQARTLLSQLGGQGRGAR
jgi:tol-pal system protein YbgF